MDSQTVLNFFDKYFAQPLKELSLGWLYSFGFYTPARIRYFSGSVVCALNARASGQLQLGNSPCVVQRIFLNPTSKTGTLKISRSDLSEELTRDPVPLSNIACVANETYNGPPPFKCAENTTLTFEITDSSGSENTLKYTVMVRELV